MAKAVLIIGEDPSRIDFSAPGMSARKVMDGLKESQERLEKSGYNAAVLLTQDAETVEAQVAQALREDRYDVIVVGAGLRTLPPMAEQFEKLINVLHTDAPDAKLAFNSHPADSDAAALRWLE
jgi:DNA-binding LacI/PurR family transcriptional regulator